MGATAAVAGLAPGLFERTSQPSGIDDGTGVHRVSDAQYREAIRSTMAELLPERYGDVVVRESADTEGGDRFWTAGEVGVSFSFDVDGMPDDPAAVTEVLGCTVMELGPTACRDTRFDGWLAVAAILNHKGTYGAELTLNDSGLTARIVVAAGSPDVLPTLDEQQAILTAPAFVDLVRLGVDYGSDRPSRAHHCTDDGDCGPMPLPVWRH